MIVCARDELLVYASPPRIEVHVDWSGSSTLTTRVRAMVYLASLAPRYPRAIGVLSGAGLTTPTFP